jgi:probable HAF family extracellular repeat protein
LDITTSQLVSLIIGTEAKLRKSSERRAPTRQPALWSLKMRRVLGTMVIVASLAWGQPALAQPTFMGLGDLTGGADSSSAYAVSDDGSTVVGTSQTASGSEAFRWTSGGGMVGLGDLPGGSSGSGAYDVSADGSVVVGRGNGSSGGEAFRWTSGSGIVGLGDLPGGGFDSSSRGVTSDGATVVGDGETAIGDEAFVWTSGGGLGFLGGISSGFPNTPSGVSADGSKVPVSVTNLGSVRAFLWQSTGPILDLGLVTTPFYDQSFASGISADGSTVVGRGYNTSNGESEAARWTSTTGMVGLGTLDGFFGRQGDALAASGDGSIVVGYSDYQTGTAAFIWDETHGMRRLQDVLTGSGLDLTGWTLHSANDISADGRVIVGSATNPDGDPEAWMAVLSGSPAVPALGGLGTVALALLLAAAGVARAKASRARSEAKPSEGVDRRLCRRSGKRD